MNKFLQISFLALCMTVLSTVAFAQQPLQMNYQGVARKADGTPIVEQSIRLRLTIKDGSATGSAVYSETRQVTTNKFGLFTTVIGGTGYLTQSGSMSGVNWASGNKFLQVEMDPLGGSSYTDLGTSQLQSVPFAMHANSATPSGTAGGDLSGTFPNPVVTKLQGKPVSASAPATGQVLQWDGANWAPATPSNSAAQQKANWNQTDTSKADYIKNKPDLSLKEAIANKSINVIADSASHEKYPSVKAVKFYVDSTFNNSLTGGSYVDLSNDQTIAGVKTFSPSITASADSTTLVGMEISPVFNDGGFNNIQKSALKLNGDLTFADASNWLKFPKGSGVGNPYNDGGGAVDLYVPEGAGWVEMNYGNRNWLWLDDKRLNVSVGEKDSTNYDWTFDGTDGNTFIPGNLQVANNKSYVRFANGSSVGDMQNILGGTNDVHGSIDLYAPEGASWVQMNYGNRSYIWIDQNNAYIGLQNNNTNTWYSWDFISDGTATFPGALKLKDVIYPSTDGTAGQVLTTDGQGNLSWQNAGGSGAGVDLTTDQWVSGKKTFMDELSSSGNLWVNSSGTAGYGLVLSDDGDFVDLNDGFGTFRFHSGIQVTNGNKSGDPVIKLRNNGVVEAAYFVKPGGTSTQFLMADGSVTEAGNFSSDISVSGLTVGQGPNPGNSDYSNTVFGRGALQNHQAGASNTAIGLYALHRNNNGGGNTALGYTALQNSLNGVYNTALGTQSLEQMVDGNTNTAIGVGTLDFLSTGSNNVALGAFAGRYHASSNLITAENTVLIGTYAKPQGNSQENQIVIGYEAIGNGSNTIQLGNSNITNMKTAGTITAGSVTYPNTTGDAGQVLTSDGNGTAYWAAPKSSARFFNSSMTTLESDKYLVFEGSSTPNLTLNSSSPEGQEIIVRSITTSVNIVTENGQRILYDNFNTSSSFTLPNNAADSWVKFVKVGGMWLIFTN